MKLLFGTSGIRASADFLTNQFCFDIGRTFAKFLIKHKQKGKIAIGMDTRKSSPRIKKAFSMGLLKENCQVVDQGIVPAPAINYILIADPNFIGSCIITGSHIRSDHNGFKFFAFKEEILKNHEKEIEKIYERLKGKIKFKPLKIKLEESDKAISFYKKKLIDLANLPYPKWKVIVDTANGCQSKIIPTILTKLGIEVMSINTDLQSENFIPRDTEVEGATKELQKKVKKEKADLGIAFDGDGDRVVFVDERGNFISGDYTGALLAKYSSTPVVITPINTSQVIENIGKKVIRTKVGSPYVVEAMHKYEAVFGFESNGGGFSKEVMMSRDGGSVTIKVLNLLKKKGKTLGGMINTLPQFFIYRVKVDCPQKFNSLILNQAKQKFKGIRIEEVDGLKIWTEENSWILFRSSSNAPEFRVFAEAKTRKKAEKLGKDGINFVKSLINIKTSCLS